LPDSIRNVGNVPVIGANGITGYHDIAKVKGPGVIIGRSGTLGKVYFIETRLLASIPRFM
jgi:type I restriction enzyme S subunit